MRYNLSLIKGMVNSALHPCTVAEFQICFYSNSFKFIKCLQDNMQQRANCVHAYQLGCTIICMKGRICEAFYLILLLMFCQVLQLFFRDYVHGWYYTISTDEGFLYDLRQTLQRALIAFANRLVI